MKAVLLDSTVYISALRHGDSATVSMKNMAGGPPVWMSAVVLEELYAGTRRHDIHIVERLERDFVGVGRTLLPDFSDWVQAGHVLARLAAKYGYEQIGRGRLTNDALIAVSAGRKGITIFTANAGDFARLAEFCLFEWRLYELS